MNCQWELTDGWLVCPYCKRVYPKTPHADPSLWPQWTCPKRDARLPGPGDHLHDAILKWVGEGPTRECGCKDRIRKMNRWGAQGCREHLGEIVDWLAKEAAKRGWWRFAVAVPGSRFFIKRMVLEAIVKAEQAAPSGDAVQE